MSKVSIIIACYNDLDIVVAVKSAYNQTYSNKEVIVVDDGSNLKTVEAIESVRDYIDILITQKNHGQSVARNNGIKKANGEYVLNLDSDDYFEPTFCEKAVEVMINDQDIKIVTCRAKRFTKKGIIDIYSPAGGNYKNFLTSNAALGSSMFRKSDWEACDGYEEKLPILGFEDWEFYIQILKSGGFAYVIHEILFNYQIRKNSTTDRIRDLKLDKFKYIILKHKELYKENFEDLMENLFERIRREEVEKIKNTQRIEFEIGKKVLKPLRWIKKSLK